MRIAQLIDSLTIGGAEKLQITFMRTALSRGIQPTLITFNSYPEQHYFHELASMGVKIIEIKGRYLFDPVLFIQLFRTLRDGKFDIIHTHLTYSIILGGFVGRLLGIPVVASIHNLGVHSWSFVESISLRFFTSRRIAVGWAVANAYHSLINLNPIDVIQNPVEPTSSLSYPEKLEVRRGLTEDLSRPLLISVGRLDESKGYNDLLDAVEELRQTHPQVLLLIAGTGPSLNRIKTRITSMGLNNHVILLGLRHDIPKLLQASDIYVTASHSEGLPVSILEALAAGLPVVATNVGDIPLVVKPEFGICVPVRQPSKIAAALKIFLDNPGQKELLGSKAREYVIQHHSPNVWLDKILNIYNQMISSNNKSTQKY